MANTLEQRLTAMQGYLKEPRIYNDPAAVNRMNARIADVQAQLTAQNAPPSGPTTGITIPKGEAAKGKSVRIGGSLYPSQEWYNVNILGKVEAGTTPAPTRAAAPPVSANNLSNAGGQLNMPDATTASDGASGISSATGQSDMLKAMTDMLKKQQERTDKATETQKTWIEKLTGKDKTSQADILAKQQEQYDISGKLGQMQDITNLTFPLNQQMADLTTQETAEIDRLDAIGMSESWRNDKTTSIHNKYNRLKAPIATQLNAYAAQAQAIQGNLAIANQYISQAVNAATYDQEFEYNRTRDIIDLNQDFISGLEADERSLFANMLNLKQDELSNARTDKTNVGNLMLQYPSAGITMNDTIGRATAKASAWAGAQPTTTGAPTVIGTEAAGYQQWNAATGQWEPIPGMGGVTETGWTDENVRIAIRGMVGSGLTKQQILDQFESDSTVTDKSRARLIIGEMLDEKKEVITEKEEKIIKPLTSEEVRLHKEYGLPVPKAAQEYYVPGQQSVGIGATEGSFFEGLGW